MTILPRLLERMRRAGPPGDAEAPGLSRETWLSAAIILLITAVASKLLGFSREILVAGVFGASAEVDAFLVASAIAVLFGAATGVPLGTTLIPLYQRAVAAGGTPEATKLAKDVVTLVALASLVFAFSLFFLADTAVHLVAPSAPQQTQALATALTRRP